MRYQLIRNGNYSFSLLVLDTENGVSVAEISIYDDSATISSPIHIEDKIKEIFSRGQQND